MAAQLFQAPPNDGAASREDQRSATVDALRRELLGYRRSGKTARADAVIAELLKQGVDVIAEEKAAERATKAKPADAEQATA